MTCDMKNKWKGLFTKTNENIYEQHKCKHECMYECSNQCGNQCRNQR